MKKIVKFFKQEVLPYIVMGFLGLGFIALIAFLFWLDKLRFVF